MLQIEKYKKKYAASSGLTKTQKSKINFLKKILEGLPELTETILKKELHQLTKNEFLSLFLRSALEKVSPGDSTHSINFILFSRKVSIDSLRWNFNQAKSLAEKSYMSLIIEAMSKELPGIPKATIDEMRFKTEYMKATRTYLRRYSSEYGDLIYFVY